MAHSLRVRFPHSIYEQVRADLARSHEYAVERVGFLSTTLKAYLDGSSLLLVTGYHPVDDEQYIMDQWVSARINSAAIRTALQRVLDTKQGVFHVHMHFGTGIPVLSRTDQKELPRLVKSLRAAGPKQAHGIFLLSEDACTCWVSLPGVERPVVPDLITVVGHPLKLINPGGWPKNEPEEQFARQSFLGPLAQTFIEAVRVGIIGLGGGGSHIVQQLAHVGVQHFRDFDGDVADRSNLNRMVGAFASDPDASTPKIEIARRTIKGLVPDAVIVEYQGDWRECPELLEQCDLVFGCVDSFAGRRDLEATCRRYLIPYIDIGMDVHKVGEEPPRMVGQVILSMPGGLCMTCLGFLNELSLAQEAAHYGDVGGRPQVIWANGVLASTAIGIGIELLTAWTERKDETVALSYNGNTGTITPDIRLHYLADQECSHFPFTEVGPPVWR